MRYKQVLFIIPPLTRRIQSPFAGVGYLSTFLTNNRIGSDVLDMNLGYSEADLFQKIDSFKPDLIGLPVMTSGHGIVYNLISLIKKKYEIDIVVGGPHASILRAEILQECQADFAIKLEGEHPLRDLCMGKNPAEINGLIYKSNGEIIENKDADFIRDIDSLPFPTYEKFNLEKYLLPDGIPIISSRGCPYSCIYCPVKSAIGQMMRARSPENVVAELKYWYEKGYKKFAFQDDNFTFYRDRVLEICDLMAKEGLNDLRLHCPNGVRADKVDRELLQKMRQAGFKQLSFGVEAGNNKVLKRLKKAESIEKMESAIKDACELGFDVVLFFLVGSPGETPQDVQDSISLALRYPIIDVFFYNLIPYPKTELFTWVKENNLFVQSPDQYLAKASAYDREPKFATPEFPLDDRRRMLAYTRRVRKVIRRRSIKRRLPKWSVPKSFWAAVLASDLAEDHILKSQTFWKLYDYFYPR